MNPNMSLAIVYDGSIRDNGTPFYARLALAQVLGQDPDWYSEDPTIKGGIPHDHDFYLHVDDGRDDFPVTGIPHPWGYWMVDSHLGPDVRIEKALTADLVWCAQKPFVETLQGHGINAKWLPLACEPLVHCTREELAARENRAPDFPIYDLGFVGHIQPPGQSNRLEFLDKLYRAVPNSWYAFGHYHEEMSRVYHRCRLGVNHAVRDDLNMRFFELASMGVPQLADNGMVGLRDLDFRGWEHYLPYHDQVSAIHRAKEALAMSPNLLQDIAADALAKVRAAHTYRHRCETILSDVEDFLQRGQP